MSLPAARIAMVINSLEGGGAERVASILLGVFAAQTQAAAGPRPELRLVLLDDLPARYPTPPGVSVGVVDARGSLARSVAGLTRELRGWRPDVTLSFLTRANLAAVAASRLGGWPCVLSERVNTSSHFGAAGLRGRFSKALVRMVYPHAERIVAVSRGVAEDLVAHYGVSPGRVEVIHNPYDLEAIGAAGREAAAVALPRPFIAAVGRLTANKNHLLLLRAFALSGIAEDLVILGEGEDRAALEAEAAALGIADRVRLPGFLANPHAVVARARAFVSASNAEGFPNAAAEAMALGRVVVLTDCPSGPAELLEGAAPPGGGPVEARYGLLTPVGDVAAMAVALRRALDPAVADRYGVLASARMTDFRRDAVAQAYARAIAKGLSRQNTTT